MGAFCDEAVVVGRGLVWHGGSVAKDPTPRPKPPQPPSPGPRPSSSPHERRPVRGDPDPPPADESRSPHPPMTLDQTLPVEQSNADQRDHRCPHIGTSPATLVLVQCRLTTYNLVWSDRLDLLCSLIAKMSGPRKYHLRDTSNASQEQQPSLPPAGLPFCSQGSC